MQQLGPLRLFNISRFRALHKKASHRPHQMLRTAPRAILRASLLRGSFRSLQKGAIRTKNEPSGPITKEVRVLQSSFDSKPIKRLKYDPSNLETDFTDFGVLPYFQERFNSLFGAHESDNVRPTVDQRSVFSILGSGHSLLLRSNVLSGKTLALIMYALSITLTRVPAFGSIRRKKEESVDTIIVAPNDSMVEKYRFYVDRLLAEVPENCCPENLVKENDEYDVTRRAFEAHFLYGQGKVKHLLTRGDQNRTRPHMVVGTPEQVHKVIGKERFAEARFLAFDDVDFSLNNTGSSPFNLYKTPKKGRYQSRVEGIIKDLQSLQTRRYQESLRRRLRKIEEAYISEHPAMARGFEHAEYVYSKSDLSTTMVSELQKKQPSMDGPLMRKLIKHKRMLLYRPVQYAFICQPVPPSQILLNKMLSLPRKEETKIKETPGTRERADRLRQKLDEEIHQRAADRKEDFQLSRIEKLVRFDDQMKLVRKQERALFAVGQYSLEQFGTKPETNQQFKKTALFPLDVITAKYKSKEFSLNLQTHFPEDVYLALETYSLPEVNVKNLTKTYLKARMNGGRLLSQKEYQERVKAMIFAYRQEQPYDRRASLIIVPPYVELAPVRKYINKQKRRWKDKMATWQDYHTKDGIDFHALQRHFSDQDPMATTDRVNLLVHPDQVIGQTYFGLTNIMALGLETLVPQLAFSQYDKSQLGNVVGHISGIEGTHQEMLSYYLRKLNAGTEPLEAKQLTVALNRNNMDFVGKARSDLDRSIFAQMLLHNDLVPQVEPLKLVARLGGKVKFTFDPHFRDNLKTLQNSREGLVGENVKKDIRGVLIEMDEKGGLSTEEGGQTGDGDNDLRRRESEILREGDLRMGREEAEEKGEEEKGEEEKEGEEKL